MIENELPLARQLRQQILLARERVYKFGQATPLERLKLDSPGPEIWVKREDLSAVKSYKWRGACNRMSVLSMEEREWSGHSFSGKPCSGSSVGCENVGNPGKGSYAEVNS